MTSAGGTAGAHSLGGAAAAERAPAGQEVLDCCRLRFVEGLRVVVVAGIAGGVVLAGVGSRLAMFLLRLTSPDRAHGVVSDDGFTIGRVTLAGTYNLLLLGAVVGMIGAGAYLAVSPRLIGPAWFRRATTGLAAGAVGGAMLVHADGVDFTLLGPTWFAIALFVALPGVFGTFIGPVVDAVQRPDSWTRRRPWRWLLPIVAIACFPLTALATLMAACVLGLWVFATEIPAIHRLRTTAAYVFATRAMWLAIAVLGLAALVSDAQAVFEANAGAG
jgi:hypothetical protein